MFNLTGWLLEIGMNLEDLKLISGLRKSLNQHVKYSFFYFMIKLNFWGKLTSLCKIKNFNILIGLLKPVEDGKKTLVVDLDETLIHSSFKPIKDADLVVSIYSKIDNKQKNIFVRVRPGAFRFLQKWSEIYEVVIFTASTDDYAKEIV